jgi:hypothetical protein
LPLGSSFGEELAEVCRELCGLILTGVQNCFAGAAETLRQTDYADACPIATVALEVASTNEPLRKATADVFENWIKSATKRFLSAGIPESTARELAIGLIGALEGAFLLSRAARNTEPMDIAGAAVVVTVQAAVTRSS